MGLKKTPRKYWPENFNAGNANSVEKAFKDLLSQECSSYETYLDWIYKMDELSAIIGEEGSWRYIKMTCQTDEKKYADAYQFFSNHIQPITMKAENELNKKLANSPYSKQLPPKEFEILLRNAQADMEIYNEENIPIYTELANLSQEYQTICGAITFEFDGRKQTLMQMYKYFENTDRDLREKVYFIIKDRGLEDQKKLDEIYDKMIQLRHQISQNAGFDNFRDYQFVARYRFDYSPDDCITLHKSIEDLILPILKNINDIRKKKLDVDTLKPWDQQVDIENKPELKPFNKSADLVKGVIKIFTDLKPEFGEHLRFMQKNGLLDLESRQGKAPGGYQSSLPESGVPFIFMNAAGSHNDVTTLLHEGGHAIHSFAASKLPIRATRHGGHEIAEVASMSMELLGIEGMKEFYNAEDAKRAAKRNYKRMLSGFPMIAQGDAFQHWIYENPNHTVEERAEYWTSLTDRFNTGIDLTDLEKYTSTSWHSILHFFQVPFYFIDYAIASIGAMQVYYNYLQNPKQTIEDYYQGLHLGGTRSLPELYEGLNIKFDFSPETIQPLVDMINEKVL